MIKKRQIYIYLLIFSIISVTTIYSSIAINHEQNTYIKQLIWYIVGFGLIFTITKIKNSFIIRYIWFLYLLNNILLLLLLFFAPTINNAKCWFKLPFIGSFQPSEFMKIVLLILIAKICADHKISKKHKLKSEVMLLIKVFLILLVPTILTFLEPDTGAVIIYFVIALSILFATGLRYRWFGFGIGFLSTAVASILLLYFFQKNIFIDIFGNSMFLRIDRLLNWGDGFQLERGLTAIAASGFWGFGFNNTPVYFPESHTDFIFAVYGSNFGYIGSMLLLLLLISFDIKIFTICKQTKKTINKYIIIGSLGILVFQQIQNIGMTLGLLPIMGITLPFISYGGSSLLSYMIIIALIINIIDENNKYTNI